MDDDMVRTQPEDLGSSEDIPLVVQSMPTVAIDFGKIGIQEVV